MAAIRCGLRNRWERRGYHAARVRYVAVMLLTLHACRSDKLPPGKIDARLLHRCRSLLVVACLQVLNEALLKFLLFRMAPL